MSASARGGGGELRPYAFEGIGHGGSAYNFGARGKPVFTVAAAGALTATAITAVICDVPFISVD